MDGLNYNSPLGQLAKDSEKWRTPVEEATLIFREQKITINANKHYKIVHPNKHVETLTWEGYLAKYYPNYKEINIMPENYPDEFYLLPVSTRQRIEFAAISDLLHPQPDEFTESFLDITKLYMQKNWTIDQGLKAAKWSGLTEDLAHALLLKTGLRAPGANYKLQSNFFFIDALSYDKSQVQVKIFETLDFIEWMSRALQRLSFEIFLTREKIRLDDTREEKQFKDSEIEDLNGSGYSKMYYQIHNKQPIRLALRAEDRSKLSAVITEYLNKIKDIKIDNPDQKVNYEKEEKLEEAIRGDALQEIERISESFVWGRAQEFTIPFGSLTWRESADRPSTAERNKTDADFLAQRRTEVNFEGFEAILAEKEEWTNSELIAVGIDKNRITRWTNRQLLTRVKRGIYRPNFLPKYTEPSAF
jgi:hypothetical protein